MKFFALLREPAKSVVNAIALNIHEVNTQQVRLVDGALTCSSLLF